jgi:hypothetical protein
LPPATQDDQPDDKLRYPLSVSNLSQHDTEQGQEHDEEDEEEKEKTHDHSRSGSSRMMSQQIVVRIEVEDTGYGIKPCDMHKLFSEL